MNNRDYYLTREVAEILEVSPLTIGKWIRAGDIRAEKINPLRETSPYRIPKSEVERFLALRKGAISDRTSQGLK